MIAGHLPDFERTGRVDLPRLEIFARNVRIAVTAKHSDRAAQLLCMRTSVRFRDCEVGTQRGADHAHQFGVVQDLRRRTLERPQLFAKLIFRQVVKRTAPAPKVCRPRARNVEMTDVEPELIEEPMGERKSTLLNSS